MFTFWQTTPPPLKKPRDGAEHALPRSVELSDLSSTKLNHHVLDHLGVTSSMNSVSGWVDAERQFYPATAIARPHTSSPTLRCVNNNSAAAASSAALGSPTSRSARRLHGVGTAATAETARSPSRMPGEALAVAALTTSEPFPLSRGGQRKASSSASSSTSVLVVSNDNDDLSGTARFGAGNFPEAGEDVSALFGSSRPSTPSVVEAQGGRAPRGRRGDLSARQIYLMLVIVVCTFVLVSYPMDTAEELKEIQMMFDHPIPPAGAALEQTASHRGGGG